MPAKSKVNLNVHKLEILMGQKIEREHYKTAQFIRKYVNRYHHAPPNKVIFKKIAADHIKENPRYYAKLKKAKL